MATYTETFTGAAGTELATHSADWVAHPQDAGEIVLTDASRARSNAAGNALYRLSGFVPASADYDVEMDWVWIDSAAQNSIGILGRMDATAATFYMLRMEGGALQLYKFVAGAATQLGNVSMSAVAGNTYHVKLEMRGTTIRGYFNNAASPDIEVTDSDITAPGSAGLRMDSVATDATGQHVDNIVVTDAAGAVVQAQLPNPAGLRVTAGALAIDVDRTVAGVVTQNGQPIESAEVYLTNRASAAGRKTLTAVDGSYSFADVLPGRYAVLAIADQQTRAYAEVTVT